MSTSSKMEDPLAYLMWDPKHQKELARRAAIMKPVSSEQRERFYQEAQRQNQPPWKNQQVHSISGRGTGSTQRGHGRSQTPFPASKNILNGGPQSQPLNSPRAAQPSPILPRVPQMQVAATISTPSILPVGASVKIIDAMNEDIDNDPIIQSAACLEDSCWATAGSTPAAAEKKAIVKVEGQIKTVNHAHLQQPSAEKSSEAFEADHTHKTAAISKNNVRKEEAQVGLAEHLQLLEASSTLNRKLEAEKQTLEAKNQALERHINAFRNSSSFDQGNLNRVQSMLEDARRNNRSKLESNRQLEADKQALERRITAYQNTAKLDQDQDNASVTRVFDLESEVMTLKELLGNADKRCDKYEAVVRQCNSLEGQVENLNASIKEANGKDTASRKQVEDLECELGITTEQMELEQAAHSNTKHQVEDAKMKQAEADIELAASIEALKASKRETDSERTRVKDLQSHAEKRKEAYQLMAKELREEKASNDFANLLTLVKQDGNPGRGGKRNRRHNAAKEAKRFEKEKEVEEKKRVEKDALSRALVVYRPHNSWFFVPEEVSVSILLCLPLFFGPLPAPTDTLDVGILLQVARNDITLNMKMDMYNVVLYDLARIRCLPDQDQFLHTCGPNRKQASNKAHVEKASPYTKSATITMMVLSLILVVFPWLGGFGHPQPNYISAAPSRDVFGAALAVVNTTCPWESPKPSAVVLYTSSTLSAASPIASEPFWADLGDLMSNSSLSEMAAHEQTSRACEVPRVVEERHMAMKIAVRVVVPTVVVGAMAFSFGWI
ncbi:hypothetical protein VTL71DRAFT_3726 [Oculimacula yallundae]|uniref:Uncharacterized protein n=1 Tax=Oculimacula yallundae TaxID=86028 RepID=A0ABR4C3V0_9HELO